MRKLDIASCQHHYWHIPDEVGELRVGVLGAGKMARLHLEILRSIGGVCLAGISNRTRAMGEELAREYDVRRWFEDPTEMLDEAKLDAVIVAVGHAATFEIGSLVLEAGVPCLLEKPAGYSSTETVHLNGLARDRRCLNMVGLNRRFYSTIQQALLEVIHQGPITGILVEAHEPIADYRSRQTFQPWLYDTWMIANTIHAIDLLRMIGGNISEVRGFGRRRSEPRGDSFSAAIHFDNGILGTFVSHWNSARGFGLKIYGNGVTAELFPLEQGFVSFDTGRRIKLEPDWSDMNFKPGLYAQDTAFLQAVSDRRRAVEYPASDLEDNILTMRLVEQMESFLLDPE